MTPDSNEPIEISASPLPKFPAPAPRKTSSLYRSLLSLILYLAAGFWLFGNLSTLLLITLVLLLHEAGHFLAMRTVGYRDLGIFFIPMIGAFVSGSKRSITQKESSIVTLAGPMPGLIIGCLLWWSMKEGQLPGNWFFVDLRQLTMFLIALNGLNLLPIYPLDGGQLLNRVFLDEEGWISRLFLFASALFLGYLAIQYRIYPLLIFPFFLLTRLYRSPISKRIEQRIEEAGIDTEVEYEALSDADYWKIRSVLIEEHPSFRSWAPDYSQHYAPEEERIRQAVEDQLHRTLIQDLSVAGKALVFLIWLAGLTAPIFIWLR